MNKNQLVKFSLTLVCSAVLAACSSGGGSSDNSAAKQQQAAAQQAAAAKAAADKAAAEAAAKTAAEKAAAEKAAAAAAAKEAQVKAVEEVGHKFVQKNASNLSVSAKGNIKNNHQSSKVAAMEVQLDPSLDTVVVAIPVDAKGQYITGQKQAYVEDYDFRGNTSNKTGTYTLAHIYKDEKGTKNGDVRAPRTPAGQDTKMADMGKKEGLAYVYQDGRRNYTPYAGKSAVEEEAQFSRRTDAVLAGKNEKGEASVTEVYGHRTFVAGNSETGAGDKTGNVAINNAPFTTLKDTKQNTRAYEDGQLTRVQYGRVTTNLDGVTKNALENGYKDGKDLVNGTKVVDYGSYGKAGTENHYFYRGVDDTKYRENLASELANVYATGGANKTPAGSLQYQGHAVTYGLNHEFNSGAGIPNAIGYSQALVSGTHVAANIDLKTKDVTGNLYDVWNTGVSTGKTLKTNQLATFAGKLENDGSIKGDATRTDLGANNVNKDGTLDANLFGNKAQELGGALKGKNNEAQTWGAVFGAKVQNAEYNYVAPKPVAPAVTPATPAAKPAAPKPVEPGLGESTDQLDTNSAIKN
ncbi:hypothetical protein B0187_08780 [Haemophilus paracuniculus]|uniref:Transferrin-binding protein B C-lobe/N-lobe beta-barrel domain-containing protein n=1 Tax=Haemophilus paracuniculus TaxID=734 RepID=A0A1T0AQD8_9PAST|nr:transferrin-binding protein-like solute binding protein [Haemophilus paracuniculus]OOR98354.1 hypothetical protein B0187_08780 [Haemophilus paracuniculus]